MRVVQAVFGVFHHFELAHQLHRRNYLQRIYSSWPWARLKREGLPHELVRSFPILHTTEYLLNRGGYAPRAVTARLAKWNVLAFDRYTASKIDREACDVFVGISGAGLLTGARVQKRGGKFICDRGSTHQRFQDAVLLEEDQRWRVTPPLARPQIVLREEAMYAQADAITVPSAAARRSFLQMGIPAEKVQVIPYGVRLDKFKRTVAPPSDSFELLFAGAVSLRKGIPYLLQSFARLDHPGKHLTVVGSISPEIRPLLGRLPTDNVTFTGPLPQPELAQRMSASHALVLPSVEEGLALVQGQAMACGCPVIATDSTGAEDLFTDGVQGFIVPARDMTALTMRMQQLADDPALQRSMSAAALARVETLGGWDSYGDQWESLLRKLVG